MQRRATALCGVVLILLAAGCQEAGEQPTETAVQTPTAAPTEMPAMPDAEAHALWAYLEEQGYQSWPMWPGKEAFYQGTEPHGAVLTTYVNLVARDAVTGGEDVLPPGSIIVKENYTPERELAAVTVMYKVEGYDPEHNDWFWLKRSAEGEVQASGRVESCQSCHAEGAGDYVRTARPAGTEGA